jgi:S-(hydroxymethyl)glutathione dehydrogenase/alcohol dehydrogenase
VAKARGATHCIDASKTAGVDGEIRKVVGPKGPDKVLQTTGVKAVIELAYELTPEGTCSAYRARR